MKIRSLFSILLCFLTAFVIHAQEGPPPPPEIDGEIVVEGLNSPQGVHVDSEGTLWVADSGLGGEDTIEMINAQTYEIIEAPYGESSRLMRMTEDGIEVVATLPSTVSGEDFLGLARITELDGAVYATVGIWHENLGEEVTIPYFGDVVRIGEEVESVASLWDIELAENPDGTTNIETHPYDIIAGDDGMLYVADAAANALIMVNPEDGTAEVVAGFEGIPGVFPSPTRDGELIADPVPTGVVQGEDGTFYVSYLSGAPFVPGSAKVVEVSADGEVSDFATGLTMLTDLTQGPDGNMYATQFGMFTQEGPVFNSGAVIRIMEDGTSEIVIDGLPFVTGIAFNDAGDGYVIINGAGIPEAGMVVLYEGLTDMEGMPMDMEMEDEG